MATIQALRGAGTVPVHRSSSPQLLNSPATRHRIAVPSIHRSRRVRCQAAGDAWKKAVSQPDEFTQKSGYIAEAAIEEADQLDEYNAKKIAAVFTRRPFLLARRLLQIAGTLGSWAAVRYSDTLFGRGEANFKVHTVLFFVTHILSCLQVIFETSKDQACLFLFKKVRLSQKCSVNT